MGKKFNVLHAPSALSVAKDITSLTSAVFKYIVCSDIQLCQL